MLDHDANLSTNSVIPMENVSPASSRPRQTLSVNERIKRRETDLSVDIHHHDNDISGKSKYKTISVKYIHSIKCKMQ